MFKNPIGKFRNPLKLKMRRAKRIHNTKKHDEKEKYREMYIIMRTQKTIK